MTEAVRIQNTFSPPNTAIYPFSNFDDGPDTFLRQVGSDTFHRLPSYLNWWRGEGRVTSHLTGDVMKDRWRLPSNHSWWRGEDQVTQP